MAAPAIARNPAAVHLPSDIKPVAQAAGADTERQEVVVRASGLYWVLPQPVNLMHDDVVETPLASAKSAHRIRFISLCHM